MLARSRKSHTYARDAKPVPPRDLSRLPPHSSKDVIFDIEGYPLVNGGLKYLWGCTYFDDSSECQYRDWWAHDSQAERVASKSFIDWVFDAGRPIPECISTITPIMR